MFTKKLSKIVWMLMFLSFSSFALSHGPFILLDYGYYESADPVKPSFSFGLDYRIKIKNFIVEPEFLLIPMPEYQKGNEYIDKPFLRKLGVNFLFDIPLFMAQISPSIGAGLYFISAEHDDLLYDNDEPGCFGCGDYTTPTNGGAYFVYGVELGKMLVRKLLISVLLKGYLYSGQGYSLDIHNPAQLDNSYLFGVKAGYYFNY
jgi:hypothetical protein